MSQLFGWAPKAGQAGPERVVHRMAEALRVDAGQRISAWLAPGLAIGVIEPPTLGGEPDNLAPAVSRDRRFFLWLAGEAFCSGDTGLPLGDVAESRTQGFRQALLDRWLSAGLAPVRELDGEYQVAVWDARERTLTLINDRFGGLPQYWAQTPQGFAFAGGVRGVLVAPDVPVDPDVDALREAVTFGGFRLGDRTNVAAVRMVEGATVQTVRRGERSATRYWTWNDIRAQAPCAVADAVPALQGLWHGAMKRRMTDRARYGQTLSGGLDSRAVLAEARGGPAWTAITYGVPGCDDAVYASAAAHAMGATWVFRPLYAGDWLHERLAHVQSTDGLIELGDLMHLEALPEQRAHFDVHMSGYIGDAVSGPTFALVATPEDVLSTIPFYGASISLDYGEALARARALVDALQGAPARFALFEHKLPQSTNRWTAAWRPWLRVRKPFVDYAFFDFCQGLPVSLRTEGRLHERWLRASYPECFRSIPNQKTGLPVLAPAWRVQAARVRRGARARAVRLLPPSWRPAPRIRAYHDNDREWRRPGVVEAVTQPILRRGAICAEVLGREPVTALVERWMATAAAPAQVIGALLVYETYHAGLAGALRDAGARAAKAPLTRTSAIEVVETC